MLQAQRHVAADGIVDHDVLAAGVGKDLQHRAGLDVLEVHIQRLARIYGLLVRQRRGFVRRLDLDDILVIGLVSQLLVVAAGGNGDSGACADARDVELADRSAEVGGVETAHQIGRQLGVGEVDDDLVADLAQVDVNVRVGQLDDDASGPIGAATEVDVADGARRHRARRRGACRRKLVRTRGVTSCGGRAQHHDDVVAVDTGLIRHELVEIQHDARAVFRRRSHDGVESRGVNVDAARGQGEPRVRQIEGNSRRVVDGERQRLRRRS